MIKLSAVITGMKFCIVRHWSYTYTAQQMIDFIVFVGHDWN